MERIDRRGLLKTTAAGTIVAAGAGTVSASQQLGNVSENSTGLTDFSGVAETGAIAFDADSADDMTAFEPEDTETPLTIAGTIYDDATWEATSVEAPDAMNLILAGLDTEALLEDVIRDLGLSDWIEDQDLDFVYGLMADVIGWLDIDSDPILDFLEDELGIPGFLVDLVEPIVEDLVSDPDAETIKELFDLLANFDIIPELNNLSDLLDLVGLGDATEIEDWIVDQVMALGADSVLEDLLDSVDIQINIADASGTYDPESELVTVNMTDVTLVVGGDNGVFETQLPNGASFTSAESGALSGSAANLTDTVAEASVVDNEFVIGVDEIDTEDLVSALNVGTLIATLLELVDFLGWLEDLGVPSFIADLLDDVDIVELLDALDIDLEEEFDLAGALEDQLDDDAGRHYAEMDMEMAIDDPESLDELVEQLSATFELDSNVVEVGEELVLDASESTGASEFVWEVAGEELTGETATATLDEPGEFDVTLTVSSGVGDTETVTETVEVNLPPVVDGVHPKDTNGDGLYEAITGGDDASIHDVQALFDHLDTPAIQNHAEFYNFSGLNDEQVTVFDVQALFRHV